MNSAAHPAIRILAEDTYTSLVHDIYSLPERRRRLWSLGVAARAIDGSRWGEALEAIQAARKENRI